MKIVIAAALEEDPMGTTFTNAGLPRARGAAQQRANFDRAQLDSIDWDAVPKGFGNNPAQFAEWKIWITDHIADAACYVNNVQCVLVLSPATWRTLSFKPDAQIAFLNAFTASCPGMKFLDMFSGPYGDAARFEAERTGLTVKADSLEEVSAAAQSLIVQASGLAGTDGDLASLRIFAEKLAHLQSELAAVEARVVRVRALVDLAGETVMSAC